MSRVSLIFNALMKYLPSRLTIIHSKITDTFISKFQTPTLIQPSNNKNNMIHPHINLLQCNSTPSEIIFIQRVPQTKQMTLESFFVFCECFQIFQQFKTLRIEASLSCSSVSLNPAFSKKYTVKTTEHGLN